MFKTRKPTTQVTITQNPRIDFDYEELVKAAKLFLGEEKAETLIQAAFKATKEGEAPQRNEKEFLNLLTFMEYWARYYRNNPQKEARYELEERGNSSLYAEEEDAFQILNTREQSKPKDARAIRNHYVHEFLQIIALRTERSYRLNLPYRIRSEAQRNRLIQNRSEVIKSKKEEGTESESKMRIHLSTKDLPRLLAAIETGTNVLNIDLVDGSEIPNLPLPTEIIWTDETPHRPELARQIFGRQTDLLFKEGKSGLDAMGREERGAILHLLGGKNCNVTFNKIENPENPEKPIFQISLEPQVEIKSKGGLEALENEASLVEYLADQYGCSPKEYVDAIPNIVEALEENLESSARKWLKIPQNQAVSEEDKTKFLREYNQITLTLPKIPTPLGSISVNRLSSWKAVQPPKDTNDNESQKAKNSKELLFKTKEKTLTHTSENTSEDISEDTSLEKSLSQEETTVPVIEIPFMEAIQTIKNGAYSNIASVNPGASISKEWAEQIAQDSIKEIVENPSFENTSKKEKARGERIARANGEVASALGISLSELRQRRTLVLENFYQIGEGKSLDGTPAKPSFKAYALDEEDREEFFAQLNNYNQLDFESKGDKILDAYGNTIRKPELAAFIENQGTVDIEIPTAPQSLHRLTRYPTGLRSGGQDIARFPYGDPKHMPKDRGQKNNAIHELDVKDFLSKKGFQEWEKIKKEKSDEATLKKIEEISKTFKSWNRGYGLILPTKATSPVDSRTIQWLNALLQAKKEGLQADEKKANTVSELYFIIKFMSRVPGMKVGGIDTPLQTQPRPSISNSLAVQLLCGVNPEKIKDLKTIHERPIELRDLEARWENAMMSDIFNPPSLEKQGNEIDKILDQNPKTRQIKNIQYVLQNAPNYLKEFNLALGLGELGIENLPDRLKSFLAILPELKSSPLTIRHEGEEMKLDLLAEIAAENLNKPFQGALIEEYITTLPEEIREKTREEFSKAVLSGQLNAKEQETLFEKFLELVPQNKKARVGNKLAAVIQNEQKRISIREEFLTFSAEEQKRVETAVERRALAFKTTLEENAQNLRMLSRDSAPFKPTGKEERTLQLLLQESKTLKVGTISEGLSEALVATEEEEEKSGRAKQNFLREVGSLLIKPQVATLRLLDPEKQGELVITKNPQGKIDVTGEAQGNEKLLAARTLIASLTGTAEEGTEPNITKLAEDILSEAKAEEVRANAKLIQDTLGKIPLRTARNLEKHTELQEAQTRISRLIKLEQAEKAFVFQVKNWGRFEETQTGTIDTAQIVFDFNREMENITKKGFGTDLQLESTRQQFLEIIENPAKEIFLKQGEEATRTFLTKKAELFFAEEKGKTSREAGKLLQTVASEIESLAANITPEGKIREDSNNEDLKKAFDSEAGIFHKICTLTETNSILANKLKTAIKKIEELSNSIKTNQPKPHAILPRSISFGTKAPGIVEIEGNTVRTNKIWIKDALESEKGCELLQLGELATTWASKPKSTQEKRERAALLIYLKAQGLQKEAILATQSERGSKALDQAAEIWSEAIKTLKANQENFNTLLAVTSTLNLIKADDLLGKTLCAILTKEGITQPKAKKFSVEITEGPWKETAIKIPSSFLKGDELQQIKNALENTDKEESKSNRIRSIRGATEVLHQKEAEELGRA